MRIGVRVNSETSGGGRVFAQQLVGALQRSDACSHVVAFVFGDSADLRFPDSVEVAPVLADGSALKRRTLGPSAMKAAVGLSPVDVLVCPGTELSSVPGVPSVLWPLTVAPFEADCMRLLCTNLRATARWTALRWMIKTACRQAEGLVFSSFYARAIHTQTAPEIVGKPSVVITPAPSVTPRPASVTESSPFPDPYFLFVSHLYPYKMVTQLITGFALSAQDQLFTEDLVIAGGVRDGSYFEAIKAAIAQHGLDGRVHLLGDVNSTELDVLYRHARSFVFSSISENAGSYALIDAFGYGLPVICSYMSSMPDLCQDAVRYYDPRDPTSLAQQLTAMSKDAELRRRFGDRARHRARELNDWDKVGADLLEHCEFIVASRRSDFSKRPCD